MNFFHGIPFATKQILRGFDCGYTNLAPNDFKIQIKNAEQSTFRREEYHILNNNCRNFCKYLIEQTLRSSAQESGKCKESSIN